MVRSAGVDLGLAALLLAALAAPGAAQGGWRPWDVRLRDGTRVVASPLGARDNTGVTTDMSGFEGRRPALARWQIDWIAAATTVGPHDEPIPGATLPPLPAGRACRDVVVRRDGRVTTGRVELKDVAFSEGIITQRGRGIDLRDVAYIRFAHLLRPGCGRRAFG